MMNNFEYLFMSLGVILYILYWSVYSIILTTF